MAAFNEMYRRAVYYDVVFRRDVRREIAFLDAVYADANGGRRPESLLDLACGPGYHARAFAADGRRAVGLDLREEMLVFAAEQAKYDGVSVAWVAADMRHLQLETPVDVALNAFDGIDCLLTNDDLIAHFRAVAANLTPGGIYVVDVTHPRLTGFGNYEPFVYRGARDGMQVEIRWAVNHPRFDALTSVAESEVVMAVVDNGQVFEFADRAQERLVTAQELLLLAQCSGGLRPVGWYGDYDAACDLASSPTAPRMIAVFQRID